MSGDRRRRGHYVLPVKDNQPALKRNSRSWPQVAGTEGPSPRIVAEEAVVASAARAERAERVDRAEAQLSRDLDRALGQSERLRGMRLVRLTGSVWPAGHRSEC